MLEEESQDYFPIAPGFYFLFEEQPLGLGLYLHLVYSTESWLLFPQLHNCVCLWHWKYRTLTNLLRIFPLEHGVAPLPRYFFKSVMALKWPLTQFSLN